MTPLGHSKLLSLCGISGSSLNFGNPLCSLFAVISGYINRTVSLCASPFSLQQTFLTIDTDNHLLFHFSFYIYFVEAANRGNAYSIIEITIFIPPYKAKSESKARWVLITWSPSFDISNKCKSLLIHISKTCQYGFLHFSHQHTLGQRFFSLYMILAEIWF